MSTQAISHKTRINLSYIPSLLIAAGLGAGIMFTFNAFFFRTFDAEIAQLTQEIQTKEIENIRLSDKVKGLEASLNTLEDELEAADQQANYLRSQISVKEEEITTFHQQVEQLSSQKAQIQADAKTLALCVFDSQGFATKSGNPLTTARTIGPGQALLTEVAPFFVAFNSFHDSWTNGNCSTAYSIAQNYQQ